MPLSVPRCRSAPSGLVAAPVSGPPSSGSTCVTPDHDDLAGLSQEFGLNPLAIEDAVVPPERPKMHLFLTAYGARLEVATRNCASARSPRSSPEEP